MSERVGVMIPTYQRPDLVRACVLQWLTQSRRPDVVCVHQNGHAESYEWCVADLRALGPVEWIHTPARIAQHQWYLIPLQRLLREGCTHFFWADHDDLYRHDHVERCLIDLEKSDFTVAERCGLLHVTHDDYRFQADVRFEAHAPGGMSSSMAFNRAFAEALADDLAEDRAHYFSDNVVAKVTLPRFVGHASSRRTTVYVSPRGSQTSAGWLRSAFGGGSDAPDGPADPPDGA